MGSRLAKFATFFLIFVAQLVGISAQAQANPTQTYSAHQYLQIELSIEDALKNGASQKLNKLLSDDFRFHSPSQPNLNKQEWFAARYADAHQEWQIRDVEVERFGHVLRIVSFTRFNVTSKEQRFVVDVWNDANKKLSSRYEAPLSSSAHPPKVIPDQNLPTNDQIRPNGRG